MKDNTTRRLALGLLGGALLLGSVVGVAVATGVPTSSPLVWGGTVTDDAGKPHDKAVEVSVAFYDGQAATTPVCSSQTVNAEAKTGRFSVVLPDACAKAVHDSPDLWSETVVGPGKAKLPRVKVAAVPYALEAAVAGVAGVAEKAGGALAGEISGLSGKVDGVVKDVADLKAGAGGGSGGTSLVVKDANGVQLGSLYSFGSYAWVLTSKGYLLRLNQDLYQFLGITARYKTDDCSGTVYVDGSKDGYLQSLMIWSGYDSSGLRHFRVKTSGGAPQKTSLVSLKSHRSLYATNSALPCYKDSPTTTAYVVELEEFTGPELGLPSNIAFPAVAVPK